MRRLTFLVLLIGALYSGYWFMGARAVERGTITAIENARDQGWGIGYSDLQTIGFPSRFDTTIDTLSVTAVDGLWSWDIPFLQVFALSYRPNNIIAAFAPTQTLRVGDQIWDITTDGLRANAKVDANTDLSFDTATAESGKISISSDVGQLATLDHALVALRSTAEDPNNYDVYAEMDQLAISPEVMRQLDPKGLLSDTIARVALNGNMTLDQPLDRNAINPLIETVAVRSFNMDWGDVTLNAEGSIDIDALGIPEGRITVTTAQWREVIGLLVNAGAIQPRVAPTITNLARAMAGDSDTLKLPVSFKNGFMSVGPLPIGPAPRFR